jgi:hypothetical protein
MNYLNYNHITKILSKYIFILIIHFVKLYIYIFLYQLYRIFICDFLCNNTTQIIQNLCFLLYYYHLNKGKILYLYNKVFLETLI